MSGAKYSVVANLPKLLNPFASSLAGSSLADSPEGCAGPDPAELEGLVSVPGTGADFQIKDIPIVAAMETGEAGSQEMLYVKPISPSVPASKDYYSASTYLTSACSSPDTSSMDAACPPTTRDFDHMYASLSRVDPAVITQQNVHLREMLVSHLDLIQQQSETILSKDKQLRELREENGLLLQKLGRMERRVRGDESGRAKSGPGQKKRLREGETIAEKILKKRKLRSVVVEETVDDRALHWQSEAESFGQPDDELTDEFIGDGSLASEAVSRPETPVSVISTEEAPRKTRRSLEPVKKSGTKTSLPEKPESKVKKSKPSLEPTATAVVSTMEEPCKMLKTAQLYYVGCKNDVLTIPEDVMTDVPGLQRGVEVPSWREDKQHYNLLVQNKICIKNSSKDRETPTWRIKSTNPLYTMEGTENIADDVLLKRHEKMEKDEKQRKRWDLQRMREQQQLQKLRARQEKQLSVAVNKREATASLLPPLEGATHICVEERIPVAAFGHPVPTISQTSFKLPWRQDARHHH